MKSFLGNLNRHLAIFFWSHCFPPIYHFLMRQAYTIPTIQSHSDDKDKRPEMTSFWKDKNFKETFPPLRDWRRTFFTIELLLLLFIPARGNFYWKLFLSFKFLTTTATTSTLRGLVFRHILSPNDRMCAALLGNDVVGIDVWCHIFEILLNNSLTEAKMFGWYIFVCSQRPKYLPSKYYFSCCCCWCCSCSGRFVNLLLGYTSGLNLAEDLGQILGLAYKVSVFLFIFLWRWTRKLILFSGFWSNSFPLFEAIKLFC